VSVKLMSAVWSLDLPPCEKFVLLALADNANDDGTCWPSVATICAKTSLAERTVRGIIRRLQDWGQLTISERYGRSNIFTVTPAADAPPPLQQVQATPAPSAPLHVMHPAPSAPPPLQLVQGTPAPGAPTPARGAPITIKEPSIEPSVESSQDARLEFLDFKLAYPERAGTFDYISAQKWWNTNLERGHTAQQMVDGAKRYCEFCRVTGAFGTQYVMKPAKFLGREGELHFLEPFTPPKDKAARRLDSNIESMNQFLGGST
jgi:Helix-turn-helix domain